MWSWSAPLSISGTKAYRSSEAVAELGRYSHRLSIPGRSLWGSSRSQKTMGARHNEYCARSYDNAKNYRVEIRAARVSIGARIVARTVLQRQAVSS